MRRHEMYCHQDWWRNLEWFLEGCLYFLRKQDLVSQSYFSLSSLSNVDIVAESLGDALYESYVANQINGYEKCKVCAAVKRGILSWHSETEKFLVSPESKFSGPCINPKLIAFISQSLREERELLDERFV